MSIDLSVVMAAYNEEHSVRDAIADVVTHVAPHIRELEIVVVNDGSTDLTGSILDACVARDPRIRAIHTPNGGHGPALITALHEAKGQSMLLLDSDRQIALDDFAVHWAAFQHHDAMLGIRTPRYDGSLRAVISFLMRHLIILLFGQAPRDAGVPFKLIRAKDWQSAAEVLKPDNVIPSVLLAEYLLLTGRDVIERPVEHRARAGSSSSLNLSRLLRLCAKAVVAVMTFRIEMSKRRYPQQATVPDR